MSGGLLDVLGTCFNAVKSCKAASADACCIVVFQSAGMNLGEVRSDLKALPNTSLPPPLNPNMRDPPASIVTMSLLEPNMPPDLSCTLAI